MRDYFYKVNGKIQKFEYCTCCGKGPFTQEQVGKNIDGPHRFKYCWECSEMLNLGMKLEKPESMDVQGLKVMETATSHLDDIAEPTAEELKEIEKEWSEKDEPKEEWFVYTVKLKDGSRYSGITQNIDNALRYINSCSGPKKLRDRSLVPARLLSKRSFNGRKEAYKYKTSLAN